ncbi:hypothetical protein [Aliamphritea ceti]|uniref:hypothetical protein n=1 Tax=Aliamphritea ceti TaxID=1524258 RepID=UPI0021C33BC5|nr:hypothetical protein [Aliamphritea ceti]
MSKNDGKVEELLAKHPEMTKPEAIKILAEKNERKNQKRAEKTARVDAKKLKAAERRAGEDEA